MIARLIGLAADGRFVEIEKNATVVVSMPTENTCTVRPPPTIRTAKSQYSLRASTPTSSPTKSKSRAGTPVASGRPGTPGPSGGGRSASPLPGNEAGDKTFTFDHCLWSVDSDGETIFAGQERLYTVLGDEFLRHSLEGYNCCIFACLPW